MIADTSRYVASFNGYDYGENVAELTEDMPTKLSLTNSAGLNGKRIGENFQDVRRWIVAGELDEEGTGTDDEVPLRVSVQRFRYAHRAEVGKQKLYLHSAADGRPAEFVWAAVENVNGLKWEAPITKIPFEISFVAEPEIWYDDPISLNMRQNAATVGNFNNYSASVTYDGPDSNFYADAEGLPRITLNVNTINSEHNVGDDEVTDPAYVEIVNTTTGQTFRLYPDATGTYIIDSYEAGIRKGSTWEAGTVYENASYEDFIFMKAVHSGAGQSNAFTVACYYCNVSSMTLSVYPRHW